MKNLIPSFFGALLFYTIIPLPAFISIDFTKVAVWLPWVGLLLGLLLNLSDFLFSWVGFSDLLEAVLMVGLWIYLTGGLHLDGVMDTADGLAVTNPEKRLQVMSDSQTGAYGVMAGVILILIKIAGVMEIKGDDFLFICSGARWGQLMSIVLYPYLKEEGKGAFLKKGLDLPNDVIFSGLYLIPLTLFSYFVFDNSIELILFKILISLMIPLIVGWWFKQQLGGHTGDSYGAVVEWSEAFILSFLTFFPQ